MLNMPQICSCFRDNTLHPKISSNQPENPSSGSNCSCGAGNVARFILPQLRGKKAEHSLAAVLGQRRANSGSRLPPSLRSSGSSSVKKAASHAAIIPATPTRGRRDSRSKPRLRIVFLLLHSIVRPSTLLNGIKYQICT